MRSETTPQTKLKQLFLQNKLGNHWAFFESMLKNTIEIQPVIAEEDAIPVGCSKIGGCPDLPPDVDWFMDQDYPLSFVAQLNCAEISDFDLDKMLPPVGILYFFFDQNQEGWGYEPAHKSKFKVYYSETTEHLKRVIPPALLSSENLFGTCRLTFHTGVSLPYWEYDFVREHLPQDVLQAYTNLAFNLRPKQMDKMLGYPDPLQTTMEGCCEWVSLGHKESEMTKVSQEELGHILKNKMDWTLLFQIDSHPETGMIWGDMGKLYFWIKKQDLTQQKFENAWLILQC